MQSLNLRERLKPAVIINMLVESCRAIFGELYVKNSNKEP